VSDRPEIGPEGRLGVLLPGFGAVATTFVAGVEAVRKGLAEAHRLPHPAQHDPAGEADGRRTPLIKDFLPWPGWTTWSSARGIPSPTTATRAR
jgi:hypothetical protein